MENKYKVLRCKSKMIFALGKEKNRLVLPQQFTLLSKQLEKQIMLSQCGNKKS